MTYFGDLSPLDFEHLVADLMEAELGTKFSRFTSGRDGGIDVRSSSGNKNIVVQAKRYVASSYSDLKFKAIEEAKKWDGRKSKPDEYWFVTSLGLTPANQDEIVGIFSNLKLTREHVISGDDVRSWLKKHEKVARAHTKLWLKESGVLDRLIHNGIFEQTDFEVQQILDAAKTYVEHGGLRRGIDTIIKEGTLVISGAPGVGKTTLARMILIDHIETGWIPLVVRDPKEATNALRKNEKRLIFFDDFLGSVNVTNEQLRHNDHRINLIIDRASKDPNLRFLMTSRDYILADAQTLNDRLDEGLFSEFKFVLEMKEYSKFEKAKILFNHVYFSDLPRKLRDALTKSNFYLEIITHKNFNPRLVKTMAGKAHFHMTPEEYIEEFRAVLKKPDKLWRTPYESHYYPEDKLLVHSVHVAMDGSFFTGVSIDKVQSIFHDLNDRLNFDISKSDLDRKFRQSIRRMDGGMIEVGSGKLRVSNPGVTEVLDQIFFEDGHVKSIIQSSSDIHELERELTRVKRLGQISKSRRYDWETAVTRAAKPSVTDSHLLKIVLKIEQEFQILSPNLIKEVTQQLVDNVDIDEADVDAIYTVLESLNGADDNEALLNRLETECEKLENWSISLDDAVWYAETIGSHHLATERMKEIGSEYAEIVIDAEVFNINPRNSNLEDMSESIQTLGEIYDIDVSEDLQNINYALGYVEHQEEEERERRGFKRSYGESKQSILKAFESERPPNEAEALSDLFKDL